MISKTIGFRGTLFSDTPIFRKKPNVIVLNLGSFDHDWFFELWTPQKLCQLHQLFLLRPQECQQIFLHKISSYVMLRLWYHSQCSISICWPPSCTTWNHKLSQINKLIQGSGSSNTFALVGDSPFLHPFSGFCTQPGYCSAADESSSPVFSASFSWKNEASQPKPHLRRM